MSKFQKRTHNYVKNIDNFNVVLYKFTAFCASIPGKEVVDVFRVATKRVIKRRTNHANGCAEKERQQPYTFTGGNMCRAIIMDHGGR